MKTILETTVILILTVLFVSCNNGKIIVSENQNAKIHTNQIAYYAGFQKKAVVADKGLKDFFLKDASTGKTVFTGILTEGKLFEPSGETVSIADYSAFEVPGEYRIVVNDSLYSFPFSIVNQPRTDVTKAIAKAF